MTLVQDGLIPQNQVCQRFRWNLVFIGCDGLEAELRSGNGHRIFGAGLCATEAALRMPSEIAHLEYIQPAEVPIAARSQWWPGIEPR